MKIILGFLFVILSSCGSRPSTPVSPTGTILTSKTFFENIIGRTIKIGNLEVAQYDFPNVTNWDDGNKDCEALGKGWRLPTKDELITLYQNKNEIGNFADANYWSSTENAGHLSLAWYQNFGNGSQTTTSKTRASFYVRAVRVF